MPLDPLSTKHNLCGACRYFAVKMLSDELGGSQLKLVFPATVTPTTVGSPHGGVIAFGFKRTDQLARGLLLLVNTGVLNRTVTVEDAAGAEHIFINEWYGHGDVEPGREMLGDAGLVNISCYGISLVKL